MSEQKVYDAIIIGCGLAGLTIGNYLAYRGYKILIIDKNHKPGGCVINFQRGDFRFDSAVHFINGCGPGGMVDNVFKEFGGQGIVEWLPINNLIHWVDVQNKYETRPPVPLQEYTEFLCKEFPHEAKNIRKYLNRYSKLMPKLFGFIKPGLYAKTKTFFTSIPTLMRMMRTSLKTVDDMMRKYFNDPKLIELLSLFVAPFAMTREKESHIIWAFSEFSYHLEGAWYPKGGAGEFTAALARQFEKNGGEILYNHEVTFIDIQKKKVQEVIYKDKKGNEKRIKPSLLIYTADMQNLANKLTPKGSLKKKFVEKVNDRDTIKSLVIVYVGLDIDVKDYGITDYELWQLNSQWRTPENYDRVFNKMDYSQLPMEVLTFYSNGPDKSCCPPGKTVISTLTPTNLSAWETLLEDGKKGTKYYEFKKKVGQQFVDRLVELLKIPILKDHIEMLEIATPLTLSRYSYTKNGTPIGWAFDLDSIKKPIFWWTSIPNLLISGHFVFPSGGMSAVMFSSNFCARTAEKRLKKLKSLTSNN